MTHATVLQNDQSMEYDILWCVCVDQRLSRNLAATLGGYMVDTDVPATGNRFLVHQ